MGIFQVLAGNVIGIVAFCIVAAGVLKLYQIHATLNEIKDALRAGRTGDFPVAPNRPPVPEAVSGEEMLRALDREMAFDAPRAPVDPEVIEPR
jgi:hypothetical protein